MGKLKKKGSTGYAATYITRSKAIKKLQISLPLFRKLCILKGVYPRDPKKKSQGKNKTYYHVKDIQYLLHDPLMEKFRELRIHRRKVRRAVGRREPNIVRSLQKNKPRYSLDHVVKQRYPTFVDALRDLDDALCLLYAFANHPQTDRVRANRVASSARLTREFEAYVAYTGALRKCFVSVKGVYYQAVLHGQTVTWLVPHQFTQREVRSVDYRVLLSFLEFYETLLGFVNWRLYTSVNLHYPPDLDQQRDASGERFGALQLKPQALVADSDSSTTAASGAGAGAAPASQSARKPQRSSKQSAVAAAAAQAVLSSIDVDKLELQGAAAAGVSAEDEAQVAEDGHSAGASAAGGPADEIDSRSLFAGCRVFVSREVPRDAIEFVLRAFGADAVICGCTDEGALREADPSITHHIVDRPRLQKRVLGREYVQPQWVFDSANCGVRLAVADYAPGQALPPHLSPFVDDRSEGYVPDYREKLDQIIAKATELGVASVDEFPDYDEFVGSASSAAQGERDGESDSDDDGGDSSDSSEGDSSEGNSEDDSSAEQAEAAALRAVAEASAKRRRSSRRSDDQQLVEKQYAAELAAEQKGIAPSKIAAASAKPGTLLAKGAAKRKQPAQDGIAEGADDDNNDGDDQSSSEDSETRIARMNEMMIPRKQRRLLQRIRHSQKAKQAKVAALEEKRDLHKKKKAQPKKKGNKSK